MTVKHPDSLRCQEAKLVPQRRPRRPGCGWTSLEPNASGASSWAGTIPPMLASSPFTLGLTNMEVENGPNGMLYCSFTNRRFHPLPCCNAMRSSEGNVYFTMCTTSAGSQWRINPKGGLFWLYSRAHHPRNGSICATRSTAGECV